MNRDLKIIKKKFGEDLMHFSRENFSTILEEEGLLSKIILDNFYPSHKLYSDLSREDGLIKFKSFIYLKHHDLISKKEEFLDVTKTPKELLASIDYELYECHTEEELQEFKKYYAKDEVLCTFRDNRLKKCRIFFLVKKNASSLKREDFHHPMRQDEYGTSVISVQFTKDDTHTLSIKNRYNSTVINADSTFSNNLDNIIPGLTQAFRNTYGLKQKYISNGFDLDRYILASDGKYYRYNYKINNIYYCSDNIIIDNHEVKKFDKSKYLVFDCFILSFSKNNRHLTIYDKTLTDSFKDILTNINKISIINNLDTKEIIITKNDSNTIKIIIDSDHKMIALDLGNTTTINDNFLDYNTSLRKFTANNLENMGNNSLSISYSLEQINLPNLKFMGNGCFFFAPKIKELTLNKLLEMGEECFYEADSLVKFTSYSLTKMQDKCFYVNYELSQFIAPNLKVVGDSCLNDSPKLKIFNCPSLVDIGPNFMENSYIGQDIKKEITRKNRLTIYRELKELLTLNIPNIKKKKREWK